MWGSVGSGSPYSSTSGCGCGGRAGLKLASWQLSSRVRRYRLTICRCRRPYGCCAELGNHAIFVNIHRQPLRSVPIAGPRPYAKHRLRKPHPTAPKGLARTHRRKRTHAHAPRQSRSTLQRGPGLDGDLVAKLLDEEHRGSEVGRVAGQLHGQPALLGRRVGPELVPDGLEGGHGKRGVIDA